MIAFLKRLLGIAETDLSNILSSFHRTVNDLDTHIGFHKDLAKAKEAEAAAAKAAAALATSAAQKADRIAVNIKRLLDDYTPSI